MIRLLRNLARVLAHLTKKGGSSLSAAANTPERNQLIGRTPAAVHYYERSQDHTQRRVRAVDAAGPVAQRRGTSYEHQ